MAGFDPVPAEEPSVMVDSSVWVAWLRGDLSRQVGRLRSLAQSTSVLLGDLVLVEVLQGARDEKHAETIASSLASFRRVDLVGSDIAVSAARNYRLLRARGITVRKAIDLLIGTWCIANAVPLLHDDRDFVPMHEHLGLLVL